MVQHLVCDTKKQNYLSVVAFTSRPLLILSSVAGNNVVNDSVWYLQSCRVVTMNCRGSCPLRNVKKNWGLPVR